MRISSNTFRDAGVAAMQQQNEKLLQVMQQVASGRRILTPADDPVGAVQALSVTQSQSINAQHSTNVGAARDSLTLEESVLGNITSLLQDVRTISVNAGNGVLTSSDRASLATELGNKYQQLLGLANTVDGSGQYLFSGYQGGVRPFSESAPGTIAYGGDQGQRLIQISASDQIAVSDAGSDVFMRIPNGNGSLVAASTHQDIFKTIDSLQQLLRAPRDATFSDQLSAAQINLDNALENVSTVRTSAGTRLNELDSVQSAGDDRALQYSQTLSRLQDVDYAAAMTELSQQQLTLQAAQKAYAQVAGLSLFSYL
ncbi:MAG: flagellar hook-associated protein FlgL [Comamonadaceae bacterium]